MESFHPERARTATELAYAEVIGYNKSTFDREEANRARQRQRLADRAKWPGQKLLL